MKSTKYIILSILLLIAGNSFAEQVDALVLKLNNGSEEVYILPDKPVLTMPDGNVVITSKDLTSTYKQSEVNIFYFKKVDENANSIESVSETVVSYKFIDGDNFYVYGLPSGTSIKVTSINGSFCLSDVSDSSGIASLSLQSLPEGVFIISFLDRSIKIKR